MTLLLLEVAWNLIEHSNGKHAVVYFKKTEKYRTYFNREIGKDYRFSVFGVARGTISLGLK